MADFSPAFHADLPASVQTVVRKLVEKTAPDQVVLFGSRARGDHRADSDFDIAVVSADRDDRKWNRFLSEVEEENWTLFKLDLVRFHEMDRVYQENILKEGRVLYG